jgi:acetyl-CoA carboxylase biotin carboxyl carrier protein
MALSDDDVREILRIIDGSDLDELRIETDGLSLHLVRGGVAASIEPAPDQRGAKPEPTGQAVAAASPEDGPTVVSPTVGVFYRSPAPGEPPFVEVGTRVEPDTIVCIIEVMKMMNSIPAGIAGTIAAVLVENAQPVQYGQSLFRVEAG